MGHDNIAIENITKIEKISFWATKNHWSVSFTGGHMFIFIEPASAESYTPVTEILFFVAPFSESQ